MQRVAPIDIGMSATLALLKRRETEAAYSLVYASRHCTHVSHIRSLVALYVGETRRNTWAGVDARARVNVNEMSR